MHTLRRGLLAGVLASLVLAKFDFVTNGAPGVRFIFLQGFPLWIGQRETASTDDWQQGGEDLERLPPELQSAGSREQGRAQAEGVEWVACTTATGS